MFVEQQSWDPALQPGWDQPGWGAGLSPALLSSSLQEPGAKASASRARASWGGDAGGIQGLREVCWHGTFTARLDGEGPAGKGLAHWRGPAPHCPQRCLPGEGVWCQEGAGEGVWGLPDPPLSVLCPSRLCSLSAVCNRTQNCTGGSLPPPKIGHLNSKLFLNEIAKKEKQLRKLLEGG